MAQDAELHDDPHLRAEALRQIDELRHAGDNHKLKSLADLRLAADEEGVVTELDAEAERSAISAD